MEDYVVIHSQVNTSEILESTQKMVERAKLRIDWLDTLEFDPDYSKINVTLIPLELDGTDDDNLFQAAVKHTPIWKRKMIKSSLTLSLKTAGVLSREVEKTITSIDGPDDIDIGKSIY